MPYTLKTQQISVKDPDSGEYIGVDVLTEQTKEGLITELQDEGNIQVARINQTGTNVQTLVNQEEARAQQIIMDAQTSLNTLETQKNTIAETVASMAELGTDTTFTTPGMAADAKATGDAIGTLNNALGEKIAIEGSSTAKYVWSTVTTNEIKAGNSIFIEKALASTNPDVFQFYSNNNGTHTKLFECLEGYTYTFSADIPALDVVYNSGDVASTYSYVFWISNGDDIYSKTKNNTDKIQELDAELNSYTVEVKNTQVIDGKFVLRDGTDADSSSFNCTDFIDISGNSGVDISFNASIVGDYTAAVITDVNKNVLWFVDGRNISDYGKTVKQQMQTFTVEIPSGGYYLRLTAFKTYYTSVSDWGIIIHKDYSGQIGDLKSFDNTVKGKFPYIDTRYGNKKVLIIGDSISADAYGNYKKWVTDLCDDGFLDTSKVTNSSFHATGFVADYADGEYHSGTFLERLSTVADKTSYDIVITFGGINDYVNQTVTWEAFTSAVDAYFEYLVDNFTQARLCVLRPLRTYNIYPSAATGKTQQEYSEYINTVAKRYCLPVLNLTEDSGFCPFEQTFKDMWTFVPTGYSSGDGVHPNAEYQSKYLAHMIKGFLLDL